ncbi:MAG TPA: hypothetical protein VK153_00065 [Candidatus Paceibacterota bacterium]|nr:hypothetical protein [Candidatus Paceibacterota bacterium]
MEILGFTLDETTIAIIFIICAFVGAFVIIVGAMVFFWQLMMFIFSPVFSYKEEVKKGKVIKLKTRPIHCSAVSVTDNSNIADGFSLLPYFRITEDPVIATEYLMVFKDESSGKERTLEITPKAFDELKEKECLCQTNSIVLYLKKYIFGIRFFDHFCFEAELIPV